MDRFIPRLHASTLEVTMARTIKIRDPFLRIEKKMGPFLELEKTRQLAIVKVDAPPTSL